MVPLPRVLVPRNLVWLREGGPSCVGPSPRPRRDHAGCSETPEDNVDESPAARPEPTRMDASICQSTSVRPILIAQNPTPIACMDETEPVKHLSR